MGRKGFSLLEIIVTVALFSFITLMIATLLTKGFRSYNNNRALIALQQECRKASELIALEVRETYGTTVSPNPMTIGGLTTWDGSTCTPRSSASTITFSKIDPFANCSSSPPASPGGIQKTIIYSFSSNQIYRQECSNPASLLMPGDVTFTSLSFSSTCPNGSTSPPLINISISAQKVMNGVAGASTFTLQTSVFPRVSETFSP